MTDRFNHFDADSYRIAQEEPTLVIGQLVYRGRLLSIEEWLVHSEHLDRFRAHAATVAARHTENIDRAARGEELLPAIEPTPPSAIVALYRAYLRAVFPRRRYRFWAPDPVKALLAMPWGIVLEAIERFFALQALAMTPRKSLETSGIVSAHSTLDAAARPIE